MNSEFIVQEMIDRLRQLQGSGEFPPLTRKIIGDIGLTGGGDLTEDRTITLDDETRTIIDAVKNLGDLSTLATDEEVAEAVKEFLTAANIAPRVYYRDFTVWDSPIATVTAPPLKTGNATTITAVTVTAGQPGTKSVSAIVAGKSVTLAPQTESTTVSTQIALAKGQTIAVSVGSTDAAKIVVSLRCEEKGTL